jgi:hypothetical protein
MTETVFSPASTGQRRPHPAWCISGDHPICVAPAEKIAIGVPGGGHSVTLQRTRTYGGQVLLGVMFRREREQRMSRMAYVGLPGGDCQKLGAALQRRADMIRQGRRALETETLRFEGCAVPSTFHLYTITTGGRSVVQLQAISEAFKRLEMAVPRWPLTLDDCQLLGLRLTQLGQELEAEERAEQPA